MIILFSGAKIVKNERINKFRAAKCFRQWKKTLTLASPSSFTLGQTNKFDGARRSFGSENCKFIWLFARLTFGLPPPCKAKEKNFLCACFVRRLIVSLRH